MPIVCLMVFNANFNNISVISRPSVLLVVETGEPRENHRPDDVIEIENSTCGIKVILFIVE